MQPAYQRLTDTDQSILLRWKPVLTQTNQEPADKGYNNIVPHSALHPPPISSSMISHILQNKTETVTVGCMRNKCILPESI